MLAVDKFALFARRHMVAAIAMLASISAAEVPPWLDVEDQVFVIRRHSMAVPGLEYSGIWVFDPEIGTYEFLAPFEFGSWGQMGYRNKEGVGAHLSGSDGLLHFQSWPFCADYDLAGTRFLRRYSPIDDPSPEAIGWAVQGVGVSQPIANGLGIAPGVYGFARCLVPFLIWEGYGCHPYNVPSTSTPIFSPTADPWPVIRRGLGPDDGSVSLAGEVPPHQWILPSGVQTQGAFPLLSVDPSRNAFWRGAPRAIELLGLNDGAIGPVEQSFELTFPPFDDLESQLEVLFYHPARLRFFGIATKDSRTCPDQTFFSADDLLQESTVYQQAECGETLGLPLTFASSGAVPTEYVQLIPVVTHSEGRNGTFWSSEVWLYNPSTTSTVVRISRVGAPGESRGVFLDAHASVRIPGVLEYVGGGPDGDGSAHDALEVVSEFRWGQQVVAVCRISTGAPDGGSYGQAVSAVPGRVGYSNHIPLYSSTPPATPLITPIGNEPGAHASFLSLDRRDPDRYRHNLGIVNPSDEPLVVTLVWSYFDREAWLPPQVLRLRPLSATKDVVVEPRSLRIMSLERLFPAEVRDGWAPRIGVFGQRPAPVWLSMVDNTTGDATFVPFSNLHWWTTQEDLRVAIPHVAHATGEDELTWRTDVYGTGGLMGEDLPTAILHPSDHESSCGGAIPAEGICQQLEGEVGMPLSIWMATIGVDDPAEAARFWRTVFPDVAHQFTPCVSDSEIHAALEVVGEIWTSGYSRTYTTRTDGGTYGGMLPFYPLGGWPVQHFAGIEIGPETRVNVGLFNGDHDHPITHRITLYSSDGSVAVERTLALQPLASFQRRLEHFFAIEIGELPDGTYGMTVLPLDDPEQGIKGRSWAWVSLVDNVTGDPTNWW